MKIDNLNSNKTENIIIYLKYIYNSYVINIYTSSGLTKFH